VPTRFCARCGPTRRRGAGAQPDEPEDEVEQRSERRRGEAGDQLAARAGREPPDSKRGEQEAKAERVVALPSAGGDEAERAAGDEDGDVPAVVGVERRRDRDQADGDEQEPAPPGEPVRGTGLSLGRAWHTRTIVDLVIRRRERAVSMTMRGRSDPRPIERLADEELMALVDGKDPAAFEVFYDRHGGAAYSLAHRIVGDRTAAEDVVQEAFLSIWRSSARYDPAKGSVRSWTLGIVRNRAIDALRRQAGPAPKLDHDDEALLEARPSEELTDSEAIRRDTAERVRGALGELPHEQSQVITLAYFGGFSHSEIASMLGAPLGTIKGRMRLGLEKLRDTLADGLGLEGNLERVR
jgi:RNA polymerase sigma-70 factor (ECF subfamily)